MTLWEKVTKIVGLILKKRKNDMCPIDKKKSNPIALLPIGVFLVLYLGLGLVFEYVLKIEMGFY